jgi:hypothetical protein
MGYMRSANNILVGKPEEERPRGRPRRKCEDNIKMDLSEIVWEAVDWILLVLDRDRTRQRTLGLHKRWGAS